MTVCKVLHIMNKKWSLMLGDWTLVKYYGMYVETTR